MYFMNIIQIKLSRVKTHLVLSLELLKPFWTTNIVTIVVTLYKYLIFNPYFRIKGTVLIIFLITEQKDKAPRLAKIFR